ncbi:Hypothetical protein HDN1F_25160 [gamma proteobacterium HdN1]|nr:Hypothetical protein HDN1F_25160 [gamma proteobacterium HdN1]
MQLLEPSKLNLTATVLEGNVQALYLTAPQEKCGTSTVALSLAKALVELVSEKVLLIDGNLRISSLTQEFKLENAAGLTELCNLTEKVPLENYIHSILDDELHFMPIGQAEMKGFKDIQKENFNSLLHRLRRQFGYIIFDASPVHDRRETLALVSCFDGVALVVEANKTRHEIAAAAIETIRQAGGKMSGVLMNRRKYFIPQTLYNWL